jgi:hypothetical protein
MRNRFPGSVIAGAAVAAVALAAVFTLSVKSTAGQASASGIPRTADGKPDFNGIWEAVNTANWDIQDHAAHQGPVTALGAAYSVPAGQGVVEGNELPYKPEALAKKKENVEDWMRRDPEVKCFMPGIPRATYMPYPFQIVQTPMRILMAYEFASAGRTIYLDRKEDAAVDSWMGWSRGSWDGDTLVIDVTGLMPDSWFDRAGNYHSDALHVVERYTLRNHDTIDYEATIEDPQVYTRPWKMRMPLYRRLDKNVQLLEYKCVEFAEEAMYGYLKKPAAK